MNKIHLLLINILLFISTLAISQNNIRAIWAPIWDISTPEDCDKLLQDAVTYKFNCILAQVRYRGDALYTPNKSDSTYLNPESKCYVLKDKSFDALDYLMKKARPLNISIYPWITVFIATSQDLKKYTSNHVYFSHPEWVTSDTSGKVQTNMAESGAWLDPGIPEVQEYIRNIILDIVKNYRPEGIHLDYIRYPGKNWGYNPIARQRYREERKNHLVTWQHWKETQINEFVATTSLAIRQLSPATQITAAVIANPDENRSQYAQDWVLWLERGYVDQVFIMAYAQNNKTFQKIIEKVEKFKQNEKIVVGLRAWPESGKEYPFERINDKILLLDGKEFAGLAFYCYGTMKQNNYLGAIRF